MSNEKPGYKDWQWLELDAQEQQSITLYKKAFNKVAADAGATGYELEIKKASLTIDRAEGYSGAFHQLADGTPFYRISITAPANSRDEGMMAFMLLSQAFARAGGASVSMGEQPCLSLDRRDLTLPAAEAINLFPQAIAMLRKKS